MSIFYLYCSFQNEPSSCTGSNAEKIGIFCLVVITTALYFLQYWILKNNLQPPEDQPEELELDDSDFVNESSYRNLRDQEDFILKLRIYLAKLKHSDDQGQIKLKVKQVGTMTTR